MKKKSAAVKKEEHMAPLVSQNTHQRNWTLEQATDVSLRMCWGRLGLGFGKNQGIRKKRRKK